MHVCSIVLHTLAPHALHKLHTKRHTSGINLCSLCLSSHGAVTAGRQLLVVDKAMQWFMEGLEAYS